MHSKNTNAVGEVFTAAHDRATSHHLAYKLQNVISTTSAMDSLLDLNPPPPEEPPPSWPPPSTTDPRVTHAKLLKTTPLDRFMCNNLITLYSKSNLVSYSRNLFFQIPSPNVVSWTSLIAAHSDSHLSLRYFVKMLRRDIIPNERTISLLIKTCTSLSCIPFGLLLHSMALKLGLNVGLFTGSALISFYSKCRLPGLARKVFDEIPERDEVCYAAVVVGLAQNSRPIDALTMIAKMRSLGVKSSVHSISGALRAAAELAALEQCGIIHAHAVVAGFVSNVVVGSALIDCYGKAGLVLEARSVFDENLSLMNLVAWNAIMSAYAQHGDADSVIKLFDAMEQREFVPDEYSFLAVLTACYNAGLVDESKLWLKRMKDHCGLKPKLEHYTCVIGAMGREGRVADAVRLAMRMPFKPDAAVWRSLLMACISHGNTYMARDMARRLIELDPCDDSAYVLIANALSAAGKWDEVAEVRKNMKNGKVKKDGGRSWMEVRGVVHVFLAGDGRHQRSKEIYEKLAELMEKIENLGYKPVVEVVVHKLSEEEKKEKLRHHSEKLAVAFGLLDGVTPPGKPLRIVKNLRICKDCHEALKYISRAEKREIIVRDVNRYHQFLNGMCSCGDIW